MKQEVLMSCAKESCHACKVTTGSVNLDGSELCQEYIDFYNQEYLCCIGKNLGVLFFDEWTSLNRLMNRRISYEEAQVIIDSLYEEGIEACGIDADYKSSEDRTEILDKINRILQDVSV